MWQFFFVKNKIQKIKDNNFSCFNRLTYTYKII